MPKAASAPKAKKDKTASGANLDFEAKLWLAADKLRNNMDPRWLTNTRHL